jgi:hypothetical protein
MLMPQSSKSRNLCRTRTFLMLWPIFLLNVLLTTALCAQEEGKQVSMGEAVEHALQQSRLTLAGGTPFHLKAHIAATDGSRPEYSADVEEYWVSPEQWRRTVQSANFSQTLVASGAKLSEKLTGDYYPFWLHDLVTALGLMPLALGSGEPGREIEGPMATIIVGGLATSTLLNLLVLPAILLQFGRFAPADDVMRA